VKNINNGDQIWLSDGSPLLARNLLVTIYDDDIGGVIIEETNGITVTAELDDSDKPVLSSFYEDEYYIRLTRQPEVGNIVTIDVTSIAVVTDYPSSQTPPGRDFTKRTQVKVDGQLTTSLQFTSENWKQKRNITVSAINDNVEEGVDYMNFASQPSFLVRDNSVPPQIRHVIFLLLILSLTFKIS